MSAVGPDRIPPRLDIPRPASNRPKFLAIIGAAFVVVGGLALVEYRYSLVRRLAGRETPLTLIDVDQGQILTSVIENGSVESANNTTVRCEVEALVGKVGGTAEGTAAGAAGRTTQSGGSASSSQGGTGGTAVAATAKSKSATTKGTSGSSTAAGTKAGTAGASTTGTSTGTSTGTGTTATTGAASGTASSSMKPTIRSFTYVVSRHVPMRNSAVKQVSTTKPKAEMPAMGGGGRGRRGGSNNGQEEKPGSTRIVSILREGTQVKKGDLVCVLDSAPFKDELQAQKIRYIQAKAYVEQVQSILDVNEITYREYRDGVLPQDTQLIRHYIATCTIQKEQATRTAIWSRDVTRKGFRAPAQLQADELNLNRTIIALREAEGMLNRLTKYTAPKILKSLEANLEAIRADKYAQAISFALEEQRLRDLERNIERCQLRAPHDGIIVYANQTNSWGRQTDVIEEGVTVREGQPIFSLPDPLHMRIKAKINETKVNQVHVGQKADILLDAYPGRRLKGVVTAINPISVTGGMISDVRIYYANIDIQEGFAELRPGLTVEVVLHSESRDRATRIPVDSVRWIKNQPYVAVHDPGSKQSRKPSWNWRKVQLGLFGTHHAEVIEGVKLGDRIVADPAGLPAPLLEQEITPARSLATASLEQSP